MTLRRFSDKIIRLKASAGSSARVRPASPAPTRRPEARQGGSSSIVLLFTRLGELISTILERQEKLDERISELEKDVADLYNLVQKLKSERG